MGTTDNELKEIKRYVLSPDSRGEHLRQMAEAMAADLVEGTHVPHSERDEARSICLEKAAEAIARFIHLAWGGAGAPEYAARTQAMLCALRDRMRGMNPDATWHYAVAALNVDIQSRLRRAERLMLDAEGETELVHHLFDGREEHHYLNDLAQYIMHLHWERRHSPDSPEVTRTQRKNIPVASRGDPVLEKHLERVAKESVATYIEQSNIVRGMMENLTDTGVLLRDRIEIQQTLGGINARTWEASGRQLAEVIEARFGTEAGRKEARLTRARWKALARNHADQLT